MIEIGPNLSHAIQGVAVAVMVAVMFWAILSRLS